MDFFSELKRRNVLRVGAAYSVGAWLIIQIAETIFPLFGFDETPARVVVIVLAIGIVPVLVMAWAFEWTPQGFVRDREADHDAPSALLAARRLDRVIMAVLALALGVFAFDKFVLDPQRRAETDARQQAQIAEAREAGRTEALVESYGSKSIAVMPFTDMSPGGGQQYLGDGIAEELLNTLAGFPELRVISRSSSFALSEEKLSAVALSQKLGVTYLMTGSVRQEGDRLRIASQLIDAAADAQVWSETFDRKVSDVLAVQERIAASVASALRLNLLEAPGRAASTESRVYDWYLRGRSLMNTRKPEDIAAAIELFERAIQSDPGFAPAFASLAIALEFSDELTFPQMMTRMEVAANRALALDPANSEALTALGRVHLNRDESERARELFEAAIEANPSNAMAHRWLGVSWANSDRQRYYEYGKRARMLDPMDPTIMNHVAMAALGLGRFEEAMAAASDLYNAGWPDMGLQRAIEVYQRKGDWRGKLLTTYRAYRELPDMPAVWGYSALQMMNLERPDLAIGWARELQERGFHLGLHALTSAYAMNHEPAKALALFAGRQGLSEEWLGWAYLRIARDYEKSRLHYERALTRPAATEPEWDDDAWENFVRYAIALSKTGDAALADSYFQRAIGLLETRLASGMVGGQFQSLDYYLAQLYAVTGRTEQALNFLNAALDQHLIYCLACLTLEPYFDGIREDPEFNKILREHHDQATRIRGTLEAEGMMLTPPQVMALREFRFDPFSG